MKIDKEQAQKLRKAGKTLEEIAAVFNCSKQAVCSILKVKTENENPGERGRKLGDYSKGRKCITCKQVKPISEFYVSDAEKGYHQANCKKCGHDRVTRNQMKRFGLEKLKEIYERELILQEWRKEIIDEMEIKTKSKEK